MTDAEIKPFIGKPVRLTLDNGRVLAGTLHGHGDMGHGHAHYEVVSDPIKKGDPKVTETIHGSERITQIEIAADDPAAVE